MTRARLLILAAIVTAAVPARAAAQIGTVVGTVRDTLGNPIEGVLVSLPTLGIQSPTDAQGRFTLTNAIAGFHAVRARRIGYKPLNTSVRVLSGRTVELSIEMEREVLLLPAIASDTVIDRLVDPEVISTRTDITARDLRRLPVTSLDEAVAIQPGVSDGSVRGGRVGQEVLVVDGLSVKNQVDAASGGTSLRIPVAAVQYATLETNGFSARYGQALSGVLNVTTITGTEEFAARAGIETDRVVPIGRTGLDRFTGTITGPLPGPLRVALVTDIRARVDDDPTGAPEPADPLDIRFDRGVPLPGNTGEHYDLFGKISTPPARRSEADVTLVSSAERRLLYDPEQKYDADHMAGRATGARLLTARFSQILGDTIYGGLFVEAHAGYFTRDVMQGLVEDRPGWLWGAFAPGAWEFAGERIARDLDSAAAVEALPGYVPPAFSNTPWSVPGFFYNYSTRGQLRHSRFREFRLQTDAVARLSFATSIGFGGQLALQNVRTFTRLQAYRATALGTDAGRTTLTPAPAATIASFDPQLFSSYIELRHRVDELVIYLGTRMDMFDGRAGIESGASSRKFSFNPRFGVSTSGERTTFVAGIGSFAQPPDFQYLVDAAFDDTVRTGRARLGNPDASFERAYQYEMSLRHRLENGFGFKAGLYYKRQDGLISSLPIGFNPDSAIFANADFGTVRGLEFQIENDFGFAEWRLSWVLQDAKASATDGFQLYRAPLIDSTGNIVYVAPTEIALDYDRRHVVTSIFQFTTPAALPIGGPIEGGLVARVMSGLPYSPTNAAGDTILGVPNSQRITGQSNVDLLLRRQFQWHGRPLSVKLDIRNLFNRRNVVAVNGASGRPEVSTSRLAQAAQEAYQLNSAPIPRESPYYDYRFDINNDGVLAGESELLRLYQRAAADFFWPVFAYGPPRVVSLGVELEF